MSKGNNWQQKSFSVSMQTNISQDRWDRIFGKKINGDNIKWENTKIDHFDEGVINGKIINLI